MIKLKSAYSSYEDTDGYRILVDRLWPRSISKQKAHIDLWLKEIAPSSELRKWYAHDETKWDEFKERYFNELSSKKELLDMIVEKSKVGTITLVYSSKSPLNNAKALLEYIERSYL
ncbi:MAG: DUF488 domain-containing protein [Desulfurella sp.]|uniref:Uncharacterized conserved protein YeaO, DUF488 family n=1 Tax=Desulfurella multipotens TaxID=79269 RepID=A0A1G6R8N3_9BACT|nr:DUF488 family protein [Desulfurella multipotens]PMP65396.1 MAG: DUF488 domain-containing protein [Desulfurella multipotens]SDD00773.1 Uncharacterized conserved protein YeaO, DUF488 family [Desulfurella multipotens]